MHFRCTYVVFTLFIICSSCGRAQRNSDKSVLETHEEIVRFVSEDDSLEGALEIPLRELQSGKKVPLIVFVHGSGQATRRDYEDVANKLHESGFATFRYDKRGVGLSAGSFQEVGPHNSETRIRLLAADAAAAIRQLRMRTWVDNRKVIVMGGSQAGWIIPVVCNLTDVSASVIFSGPTVSVGEEIYYSDLAEHGTRTQSEADELLSSFDGVHGFDNISYVSAMKRPSLWIFGGKDVSIPVKECIRRLDSIKALKELPAEIKLYPGGDHGLFNKEKHAREDYVSYVIEWLGKL